MKQNPKPRRPTFLEVRFFPLLFQKKKRTPVGGDKEKVQKTTNDVNELNQNNKISNTLSNSLIEKENTHLSSKTETKKPLEQVNISDLLALHKKS